VNNEELMAALGGLLNQAAAELGASVESDAVGDAALQRLLDDPTMTEVRACYPDGDVEELRGDLGLVGRLIGVMGELVGSTDADLQAVLARHGLKTDASGEIVRA